MCVALQLHTFINVFIILSSISSFSHKNSESDQMLHNGPFQNVVVIIEWNLHEAF